MEIPFIGGAYAGRSLNLNAQICQNWIPISDQMGGKAVQAMMGTPGLVEFCDTGTAAKARAAIIWDGYLYAVFGDTLFKIDIDGTALNVGTLLTASGPVYMAGGMTHICIVEAQSVGGAKGYYQISGATSLTAITHTDFPIPSSLCYLDGYFIVSREDTDEMYISDLEDASSWNALDFASAEDQPDDVLLVHAYLRHLIAFGDDTVEIFYHTGDTDYPFTRVAGAVYPFGLGAAQSAASGPEGLFFLDSNYQVRRAAGYDAQVISTEQIDYQIRQYGTKSDAIGYTYTQEGHGYYVLTFVDDSKTLVFDNATGLWHTRSSGLHGNRHKSAWHQWFAGKNLVGDPDNGKVYELSLDTYTDDGDTIRSVRATQVIHTGRKYLFHYALELDFEAGVGLESGETPTAILDWSDDGGHTWSNEIWTSIGKIGQYENRAIWRRLGRSRNRIYRLAITDPVKRVLISAHLDAEAGNA